MSGQRIDAERRWREARIAAGPALRRRAQRRRKRLRVAVVAAAAIAVLALVVAAVFAVLTQRAANAIDDGEQAQLGARAALTTMLTADPTRAQAYVDGVAAVSTGEQRQRIDANREGLIAEISRQTGPSRGQVLSTTLVGSSSGAADVDVLVVAEATNAALIGADTTAKRVPVVVTMRHVDGRWLVAKARLA